MLVNINDTVKVKLTPFGKKMLEKDHYELFPKHSYNYPFTQKPEDAEGYSSWQLWSLMTQLGDYLSFGSSELPFESDIKIC